jgi:hypothetical protein
MTRRAKIVSLIAALVAAGAASASVVTSNSCGCRPPLPKPAAWPVISGATSVGSTLSTTNGTWVASGDLAPYPNTGYSYAWEHCDSSGSSCSIIGGATSNTYTLASGDSGHTIRAIVTATNAGGSTSQPSPPIGVVGVVYFNGDFSTGDLRQWPDLQDAQMAARCNPKGFTVRSSPVPSGYKLFRHRPRDQFAGAVRHQRNLRDRRRQLTRRSWGLYGVVALERDQHLVP